MRINCHAHVFNFKSVFTEHTIQILLNRLTREKWPDFILDAIAKALKKLVKGSYLDEEALLRELVKQISVSKRFASYVKGLNRAIPGDVSVVLHGDIDGLAVGALRELLRKVGDLIDDNKDAENKTLSDLIAFLAIGFQPTIDAVAHKLMELSGDDTAVVALMMDITTGGKADEKLFLKQLEDTSLAALAYPGRLLPFVAVNSLRISHFERMEWALTQKGFVGVKLYPSLGYKVDDAPMRKVYAYCEANEVPLLMHCNKGGFWLSEGTRDNSDPALWSDILRDYPRLKICFGHFGGDENLVRADIPATSWTGTILALMERYPGVYADIAYHDLPMQGGDKESNYFRHLGRLLRSSTFQDRILFGSDYFLIRQRLREDNHWRYFEAKFNAIDFRRLAETNPRTFLGLPETNNGSSAKNISRYVDFLVTKRDEVGAMPPPWVERLVRAKYVDTVRFRPNPWGVRWTINNDAHYYVWQFFRTMMKQEHVNYSFNQAGGLLVRQLPGWPSEQVPAEIRAGRLREHAAAVHEFMTNPRGPDAQPEPDVTRKQAERRFFELFANGDTKLAEFGQPVDNFYHFKKEGMQG